MRTLVCVLALVAVASAAVFKEEEYQFLFSKFMSQYNKKYAHDQFFFRYTVFKQNMDKIYLGNKQNFTYTLGMNEMGDMTHEEFKAAKLGYRKIDRSFLRSKNLEGKTLPGKPACPAPQTTKTAVDWVKAGAVTPIKNQGQCGSCWSFSTTGSVEGAEKIFKGKLVSLSEQQLVDCSGSYGNQGCNGGLMDYAFEYIISNKGLDTESSYPYTARDGTCRYNAANSGGTLSSYKDVQAGSEAALQSAVATVGPISVAIDASHNSFQFYKTGVYNEPLCSSKNLDHGVLAVGYGTDASKDYWLVKNSWGTSWGDQGYIMMTRNKRNQCGIATAASYPIA